MAKREKKTRRPRFRLPAREWDRGTELVKLFVVSGFIANARPASLMFVSDPGSGKTELLDRFRVNSWLRFQTDVTLRGLMPIVADAQNGLVTHLVATEFQKLFQRKLSVAENCIGTIVQAMEEGIHEVNIFGNHRNYGGARLGIIGAMTEGTLRRRREHLCEMGFLSRAAVFIWDLPKEEERGIMDRISKGDTSDLEPIALKVPEDAIPVELGQTLSDRLGSWILRKKKMRVLRLFQRFRTLAMSAALLEGRDFVKPQDVERILAFESYWDRLIYS